MLDLKRLHYLDAVYRYRNFTRASEELFVSQPAISAAVSSLEKQLGVKLIMRTPKAVEFTDEGEQFSEFGATVGSCCLAASSADSDTLAVDAGRRPIVQRYDRTGEPVEQVLQMARITGVIFRRENPKRISLADSPADAGHGGRFWLLDVLI